jgi:tRNA pseudouridine38-40 synthase
MEVMDKLIEEKTAEIKEKKEEKWNAKKKRRTARQEIRKKREWHEPESEESKRTRLELGEERIKRKKFVVLLGYSGVKYSGMQKNPGASTIEDELLKAMVKVKWVTPESYEQPQVALFQRAARTDKGVSACRQVVSLKIRKILILQIYLIF